MITIYLRNGDLAELDAETVETKLWDLGDGSSATSLVCIDGDGDVVGQFFLDAVSGWGVSVEETFDFEDEDE